MKTAMQELEEKLKDNLKQIVLNADYELMDKLFIQALEKEKEQIMKANMDGYKEGCTYHSFDHRPKTTEEYYNQTYNN
jgi:hypothetical protein